MPLYFANEEDEHSGIDFFLDARTRIGEQVKTDNCVYGIQVKSIVGLKEPQRNRVMYPYIDPEALLARLQRQGGVLCADNHPQLNRITKMVEKTRSSITKTRDYALQFKDVIPALMIIDDLSPNISDKRLEEIEAMFQGAGVLKNERQ